MIILYVREIAERQGHNMLSLANKAGIAYGTARSLWKRHNERIDFNTLDRLCQTLNVEVGDLIRHEGDIAEK